MVRYRTNDGHQRTVYERSKYDAIVKANERIRYDLKNPETAVVLGRLVLDAWFDKWLKKQAQSLKESTIVNYQRKYDCHIRGTSLGKKQCAKIIPSDLEAGLLRVTKNSVRVILWIVLKMAFSDLLANGAVRTNPAEQLTRKPERIKAREKPVFTWAQMELFLTKLWARDELLARYARFIAASGMRSGEALGVEWADIDFDKGLISVTKQYDQRLHKITTPKTESSVRVVPLLNGCKEALDGMKRQKGAIFKNLQPHCVSAKFTHEAKMLGMNGLTLHGLRHFFTSQCYQNGVDPAVVKKTLGHSNLSTTLDIYTHLDKPFEDAELQKMAKNGGYDPMN
jgi:integrase